MELPDAPVGSTQYRTLFLGAVVLFAMTFVLDTLAEVLRLRLRERNKIADYVIPQTERRDAHGGRGEIQALRGNRELNWVKFWEVGALGHGVSGRGITGTVARNRGSGHFCPLTDVAVGPPGCGKIQQAERTLDGFVRKYTPGKMAGSKMKIRCRHCQTNFGKCKY